MKKSEPIEPLNVAHQQKIINEAEVDDDDRFCLQICIYLRIILFCGKSQQFTAKSHPR